MNFPVLTSDNLILYAMKNYDVKDGLTSYEDFEQDFRITTYIKKLLYRYRVHNELKDRLILNHLIVFYNVFGAEAATRILFFTVEEIDYPVLKSFLYTLSFLPDQVTTDTVIHTKDIPINHTVIQALKML